MSFVPEVIADGSGTWNRNALCFATEKEAQGWVDNLRRNWTLVIDTRVVETDDPVNYCFNFDTKEIEKVDH